MKFAGLNKNDFTAAPGVSVTLYTQGCPHRCQGCHNPETWDYDGGKEFTHQDLQELLDALTANGITRSLAIQGGEPLCIENEFLTHFVISVVRKKVPDAKIYVWTGFLYEDLLQNSSSHIQQILEMADVLIDGPYVEELRDITLPMRGSSNQRIINLTNQ